MVKLFLAVIVRVAVCDTPFDVAVMVELVSVATDFVDTVNVAVVAPAATETVVGTLAVVPLAASATDKPPVGAALARVTVPVDVLPPVTEVGLRATEATVGAVIVNDAVTGVPPFAEAPIEAVWFVATAAVVTVKVPLVDPAAMEAVAGTVAAELFEERATDIPPVGAALLIVTVPVEEVPPTTEVGFKATVDTVGELTVNAAV